MYSERGFSSMTRRGFPHSEICVSTPACGSTQLIAANHVLHRLLTPRHPPSALSSLTTSLLESFRPPAGSRPRFAFRDVHSACQTHALPWTQRISHNRIRTTQSLLDSRFVNYSVVNEIWAAVGLVRFELTTPRLSSVCSNQLSYRPARHCSRSFKTDSRR